MYKGLFISLLLFAATFSFTQDVHTFDDVVEIGNFFESQLPVKIKLNPDPGDLFYDYDYSDTHNKNQISTAGILNTCILKKNKFPQTINSLKALKKINLSETMMHEISVGSHIFVEAIETVYASKIKNKEELEHAFEHMQKNPKEKLKCYHFIKYLIGSLQHKDMKKDIGEELKKFADLKTAYSVCKSCYSFKSCKNIMRHINTSTCLKYFLISCMMYAYFV